MDYLKILKRAFEITIKNKYLWIFGILAGGAAGGANFNFTLPGNNFPDNWKPFFNETGTSFNWETFWSNYGVIIITILVIIFLLGLLFAIVSIIAEGGLLGSVKAIEENQEHGFKKGFVFGWHKFWRLLGVDLIIFLFVFLSILLLAVPVIFLILAKIYVFAVIYGILIFLCNLLLWLFLGLAGPYILRSAVLGDQGAWQAVMSSWKFFSKHWKDILVIYLLLIAVGILIAIVSLLVFVLLGGLLFVIGLGIYLVSQVAVWIYAAFAGLIFLAVVLVWGGAVSTFRSSVFTLTYLELIKKNT